MLPTSDGHRARNGWTICLSIIGEGEGVTLSELNVTLKLDIKDDATEVVEHGSSVQNEEPCCSRCV